MEWTLEILPIHRPIAKCQIQQLSHFDFVLP